MTYKRLHFNWNPLQITTSLYVSSDIPDKQTYDEHSDVYSPDYRLDPLVLMPQVTASDKGGAISGTVNEELYDIKWSEFSNGVWEEITSSNTEYSIVTMNAANKGEITILKNSLPGSPVQLNFEAKYKDYRTGQVYPIQLQHVIRCTSVSSSVRVELDVPGTKRYDPFEHTSTDSFAVTPSVFSGDKLVTDKALYDIVWEKMDEDGEWHVVGEDDVMDYGLSVDDDVLTIPYYAVGLESIFRCRCRFSETGNARSVTLDDSSPQRMFVVRRRVPSYDVSIHEIPTHIIEGTENIHPLVEVTGTKGLIQNWRQEMYAQWTIETEDGGTHIADGAAPSIPTKMMDQEYGAVFGVNVIDKGHIGAWTDTDGSIIEDADGKIILIQ